jgi:hypothetical protein
LVDTEGENEVPEEKPAKVPLCPLQIPWGVTRAQTWVAGVRVLLLITEASFKA